MPTCEYCGEEFPKGGAHATHVRYCADRPDSKETTQDEEGEKIRSGDAADPDSSDGTTTKGIGTESSEGLSEHQETATQRQSEESVVATESPERTDTDGSDGESAFESQHSNVSGQSSHRLLAVVLLALSLVVVWSLLRRGEEEDGT